MLETSNLCRLGIVTRTLATFWLYWYMCWYCFCSFVGSFSSLKFCAQQFNKYKCKNLTTWLSRKCLVNWLSDSHTKLQSGHSKSDLNKFQNTMPNTQNKKNKIWIIHMHVWLSGISIILRSFYSLLFVLFNYIIKLFTNLSSAEIPETASAYVFLRNILNLSIAIYSIPIAKFFFWLCRCAFNNGKLPSDKRNTYS
jgi:hypothetical protein